MLVPNMLLSAACRMMRLDLIHRLAHVGGACMLVLAVGAISVPASAQSTSDDRILIEDFQDVEIGELPSNWGHATRGGSLEPMEKHMDENQKFYVTEEGGEKFLRGESRGEAIRMSMAANGEQGGIRWDMNEYPRLQWSWRAQELPEGAREDENSLNDTGAALYVTFETNWVGLPRSIKYTYSSTLPVGTVVSFRGLRVIVVASGQDDNKGEWITITRNVVEDYDSVFGRTAPDVPLGISLWTDSTETGTQSKADFGALYLLPPIQRR